MRQYLFYFLLGAILLSIPAGILVIRANLPKQLVLGEETKKSSGVMETAEVVNEPSPVPTESPTPSVLPSVSPSPKPIPSIAPSPSPTSTPSPTPTPASSEQIYSYIEIFAGQYGVSADILRHIAICESGFRSNATNGPYIGLYQFGPTTWKNLRLQMRMPADFDLRYSAEESVKTAAFVLSQGRQKMWPNCVP